ncbi:hypothetical protein HHI36_002688 [Cryptolaemus montrouzieri]|uniref:Uncharacterized protein n=1 Tax=Cryptolaemus montrouzieri TaxID=559131 RepID=A0ABD2PBC1_9CUCU
MSISFISKKGSVVLKKISISESIREIVNSIKYEAPVIDNQVVGSGEVMYSFKKMTFDKLKTLVSNLKNKSSGDDYITVKVFKEIFCVAGYHPLNLINTIFTANEMPAELKVSTIAPIALVPSPKRPEGCRPINLLPAVEKKCRLR